MNALAGILRTSRGGVPGGGKSIATWDSPAPITSPSDSTITVRPIKFAQAGGDHWDGKEAIHGAETLPDSADGKV